MAPPWRDGARMAGYGHRRRWPYPTNRSWGLTAMGGSIRAPASPSVVDRVVHLDREAFVDAEDPGQRLAVEGAAPALPAGGQRHEVAVRLVGAGARAAELPAAHALRDR